MGNYMEKEMREFGFYLDAWKFCYLNSIPITCIRKKEWSIWVVEFGKRKVVDIPLQSVA